MATVPAAGHHMYDKPRGPKRPSVHQEYNYYHFLMLPFCHVNRHTISTLKSSLNAV